MEARAHAPRARRRIIFAAAAVLAVGGAAAGLVLAKGSGGKAAAAKSKKAKAEALLAAPVQIARVRRGAISTHLETTTTLEARNAADIVARRAGQVVALLVEEGQAVRTGQTLARLDDVQARLAVERAEVAAAAAEREAKRAHEMYGKGFLSPREMDDHDLKLKTALVELKQARRDLEDTRIAAPFAGRVVDRSINLGETVTAGRACFRLADFDPIIARVYIPERDLVRVRTGQEAVLTLDADPGRPVRGSVALVNPAVGRANGTVKVTVAVPNPGGTLRPGAFARVRLTTGRFAGALLVPKKSVLSEDGDDYVFVARGDSAVRLAVRVGAVEGDTAQVVAGLGPGERVVTVGQGGLKTGARIRAVAF